MTDRLLRTIPGVLWDIRILWRLDNDAWHAFRDAPDHVVSRWAATNPDSVHTHQLQNGILEARDELALRVEKQLQVDVPKPVVSQKRVSAPGPRSSSTTTSSPSR